MEWLKDKKNLPIVVGLAVFVFLAAGGLIAFELGAFSGGSSSPLATTPTAVPVASGYPGGRPGGYPSGAPSGVRPGGAPGGYPGGYPGGAPSGVRPTPAAPGLRTASAAKVPAAAVPTVVNPMVGPDPFALPIGHKPAAPASGLTVAGVVRPSLRGAIPPLDLYALRPPSPQASGSFNLPNEADQLLASTRVSGIVNAADGIFAVVEVNGTSQTVKPGDSLPDGSKVASIQSSGVTLHTPGGGAASPCRSPMGRRSRSQPNPYGGGFGGWWLPAVAAFGGYPGAGGFGGGYPGAGGFGGGYPGTGGGGYPGGGGEGFPGAGGGGGYPGGGAEGGDGGGYPQ